MYDHATLEEHHIASMLFLCMVVPLKDSREESVFLRWQQLDNQRWIHYSCKLAHSYQTRAVSVTSRYQQLINQDANLGANLCELMTQEGENYGPLHAENLYLIFSSLSLSKKWCKWCKESCSGMKWVSWDLASDTDSVRWFKPDPACSHERLSSVVQQTKQAKINKYINKPQYSFIHSFSLSALSTLGSQGKPQYMPVNSANPLNIY